MIFHNEDLKTASDNTQHDIYTTPFKDEAFLFHRSFFSTYQRLEKEQAYRYVDAILAYAFYNAKPDDDNPVWENGLDTVFLNMDIDAGRNT